MGYAFDWAPLWAHRADLVSGLLTTVLLSACGLVGAMLVGLPLGLLGASRRPALRRGVAAVIELVRSVPLLLHIQAWYLGLAALDLPAFLCAALGLSLYSGVYAAEIVRAGVDGVPAGVLEAARALGLRPLAVGRTVLLPLAWRATAPSLASLASQLVKDSSLASVIAVAELTYQAGAVEADTFRSVEVYAVLAAAYLSLVTLLGLAVRGRRAGPGGAGRKRGGAVHA